MQRHNDWWSVMYYSQKMIFTKRNYKTDDEKLFAIVESVHYW